MCVLGMFVVFFFFKQKTAYEMRISDWSSDVCSSDLLDAVRSTQRRGVHLDVDDYAGQLQEPAAQLAHMEMQEFRRAFAQLSEGERKILLLVGMEGFS